MVNQVNTAGICGSAEFQLLLAALRLDADRDATLQSTAQQPLDWRHLHQLAAYHGVLPLLYTRLKAAVPESVPAQAMHAMTVFQKAHELRTDQLSRELLQVMRALEAEGIPVLSLKGPVLSILLYDNPALRCFGDLDLLVPQREYQRAEAVLHHLELQPVPLSNFSSHTTTSRELTLERERAFRFPRHQTLLELHWRLATCEFPRMLETDGVFARRRTVLLAGRPLATLGDRDTVMHVCLHGTQHSWNRLCYLVDFAASLRLLTAPEGDAFFADARQLGLSRSLAVAAPLCREFLGVKLPAHVIPSENRHPLIRWSSKITRSTILSAEADAEPVIGMLVKCVTAEQHRYHGLRPLWRTMFAPTSHDYAWVKLPRFLHWLYPVLRPIRRIGKGLAIIRKR